MKPYSTLVALGALIFCASFVRAEEHSLPFITSLSSTTVRGYVRTEAYWQPHVCRPVLRLGLRRVNLVSSDGTSRVIGYGVRCRHAEVFVPNNGQVLAAPNRSSRFVSAAVRRAPRPVPQNHSGGLSGVVITFAQPQ
jgi:hypothetical protein